MSRNWLLKWGCGLLVSLVLAAPATATPIRPDVQRLLASPQTPTQFVPARAGWHGPEMPAPAQAIQGQIDGATSARAIRASLVAAAIPDPWAVLAIVAAILLLRWMRLKGSPQQLRPQMAEEALEEGGRAA